MSGHSTDPYTTTWESLQNLPQQPSSQSTLFSHFQLCWYSWTLHTQWETSSNPVQQLSVQPLCNYWDKQNSEQSAASCW